jgi:hypothetical protein
MLSSMTIAASKTEPDTDLDEPCYRPELTAQSAMRTAPQRSCRNICTFGVRAITLSSAGVSAHRIRRYICVLPSGRAALPKHGASTAQPFRS